MNSNNNNNIISIAYGCCILFVEEAILATIVVKAKTIMSKILHVGPGSSTWLNKLG